jgi:ADP-ribose pyrophosphatase
MTHSGMTGGVQAGEALEEAAQRELMEEIGFRANELTWISSFHTSQTGP